MISKIKENPFTYFGLEKKLEKLDSLLLLRISFSSKQFSFLLLHHVIVIVIIVILMAKSMPETIQSTLNTLLYIILTVSL